MLRRLLRTAAVTALVTAAVGLPGVLLTPADAAACGGATGVTVVVEPNGLGGGTSLDCVADGGGDTAASLYPAAGHPLTYAQRQPGYVCRVDGAPASDPCVNTSPASAYWGLWWTDGRSGSWNYSTLGVGSLRIPDGGAVAFVWDQQDGDVRPASAAPVRTATASPSTRPTTRPTSRPSASAGGAGAGSDSAAPSASASASSSAEATSSPTSDASSRPSKEPSASGTPSASASTPSASPSPAAPAADAADAAASDGGLPGWVTALSVVLVVLAALIVTALRRLRGRG